MPFNINTFKANLGGSLASPSNFRVMLTGSIFKTADVRMIAFMCNQALLPGRQFATTDYTTHGPTIKMPNQTIYDDLVLSFYCKEDMEIKSMFQSWQNYICNNDASNEYTYFDEYSSNILIEQYDKKGNVTYACKVMDTYPMMVSPLQLDWGTQNGFHNLQVTFAYRYWKEEIIVDSPNSPKSQQRPFENFMGVNELYPNIDIGGALSDDGAAILSSQDGQFSINNNQTLNFIRNISRPIKTSLSASQHAYTSSQQALSSYHKMSDFANHDDGPFNDRHLLFDV